MANSAVKLTCLIGLSALAGCSSSTVESDFLCDAPTGTPCATISQIDGQSGAVRGPGGGVGAGGGQHERSSSAHRDGSGVMNRSVRAAPKPIPFEDPVSVSTVPQTVVASGDLYGSDVVNPVLFREPERVTTVWIAPFVGENGYLYQPGFVHFVVEQGRWFGPGGVAGGVKAPRS